MAIARLLKAEIVSTRDSDSSLLGELERSRLLHIEDIHEGMKEEVARIEHPPALDVSSEEEVIRKAKIVLDVFARASPVEKGLLESFFGSSPYIEESDFQEKVSAVDIHAYEAKLSEIVSRRDTASGEASRLRELESTLEPWVDLHVELSRVVNLHSVVPLPLAADPARIDTLCAGLEDSPPPGDTRWVEVSRTDARVSGILCVVPELREEIGSRLSALSLGIVALPSLDETPSDALVRIRAEISAREGEVRMREDSLRAEAEMNRPAVRAILDEHVNRRKKELARRNLFHTRSVTVVRGWVLARDREKLQRLIAESLTGAEVVFGAPEKGDAPPVKLENPRVFRPFQTLLEMFGLPPYFGIDPTIFVAIAMSVYYAICLGDAGYGALQILLTLWLKRRFKPAEGTRLFLDLFTELGVCTVIFGILTWSFFGTNPGYARGGPKILGIFPVLSPTSDIITIIAVAFAIGSVFQLSSIIMGFYASLKAGDIASAVADNLAWFFLLVGVMLWAAGKFLGNLPRFLGPVSWALMGLGGLAILCFAGRGSKGIGGRIVTGVISFYGILGYYGIVSFFGDVLSYLRIAILNLTGGFIAFVANVIGQLLIGTGSVLFTAVTLLIALVPLLLFHTLNLILSMMGSFIHSLRLNYLESFSRYYKSGGKAFAPFRREGQFYRFER